MPRLAVPGAHAIPLWVKLAYTAFLCILVPYYWRAYGPTNFLYFCDVALFMALVAVWSERSIWASMPAVGILMPQALWMVDFLGGFAGLHLTGMTAYMFSATIPLFTRALSLFHFWLPLFLLWTIWRLGYDRRALATWTVLAWVLMLVCYFLMPPPPAPADDPNLPVNINYVYGLNEEEPQEWMPPLVYLGLMMIVLPLCVYLPTHLVLSKVLHRNKGVAHDRRRVKARISGIPGRTATGITTTTERREERRETGGGPGAGNEPPGGEGIRRRSPGMDA